MEHVSARPWAQFGLPIVAAIVAGLVVFGGWWSTSGQPPGGAADQEFMVADGFEEAADEPAATVEAALTIFITGEVAHQNMYTLPASARVGDAVEAAGGLTTQADLEQINLAQRLGDEQHIHIPAYGAATSAAPSSLATLDLNSASLADLTKLEGIGETLAERIVAFRDEQGPFTSLDQLGEIAGIKASLLEKLAAQVRVGQ